MAKIHEKHPRAYAPWDTTEDQLLKERFLAGQSVPELAVLHQRRPSAIRSRLRKRGLMK
jgi:hypothetical protein